MISAQNTPELVVYALFAVVVIAVCVASWGKRLGTKSYWLTGLAFGILVIALSIAWTELVQDASHGRTWMTGWIGDRDEPGAITVGINLDYLSLMSASVLTFISALAISNFRSIVGQVYVERFLAASLISLVGSLIAWFALTPWIFFLGLALAITGGFLSFGSHWDSVDSSEVASRFGWERSWGLISAILGTGILAGGRTALLFSEKSTWAIQNPPVTADWVGASLLLLGLVLQFQPVTNVTWLSRQSKNPSSIRLLLNQCIPAWASFALLVRVEPQFREMGILDIFGWITSISAFLSLLVGLFQASWISGFLIWVSAGYSLILSALFFAGPAKAYPLLLGLTLGSFALNFAFVALDREGPENDSNGTRALWAKIGVFGAILAATDFIGFVGAGASLVWLENLIAFPFLLTATAVVMFVFAILGWRLSWKASRINSHTDSEWMLVISPTLLFLGALAIWWTGTLSGGVLPDAPDALFHSAFASLFSQEQYKVEGESFATASGIKWGVLLFGIGISYWISRPSSEDEKDPWQRFRARAPKFSGFLANGYHLDALVIQLRKGLIYTGGKLRLIVDEKVWSQWIPNSLLFAITRTGKAFSRADEVVSNRVSGSLRPWVDVTGKVLQIIQNGDVRWYVFFAIGMGVSILVHFFRIRG